MKKIMKVFVSILVMAMMITLVPVQQVKAEEDFFIFVPDGSGHYPKNSFNEFDEEHMLIYEDTHGVSHAFYFGGFEESENEGMGIFSFYYLCDELENKADILVAETLVSSGSSSVTPFEQVYWELLGENEVYLQFEYDVELYNDAYLYMNVGVVDTTTGFVEYDSIKIKNNFYTIPIESISLSYMNKDLAVGHTFELGVTFYPKNTTDSKALVWTSSNESVATVDENGIVTGVSLGEAVITATALNGSSDSCTVVVGNAIESVSFEKDVYDVIRSRENLQIKLIYNPSDNIAESVKIEVENEEILYYSGRPSVDVANFYVLAPGSTKITVTSPNGASDTCVVNVDAPILSINFLSNLRSIYVGRSVDLNEYVSLYPDNTNHDKTLTWTSSDESVLTIDSNGLATGVGVGEATITVMTANGLKDEYVLPVKSGDIRSLTIKESVTINADEKYDLGYYVRYTPYDTPMDKTLTWTSNNEKVATVDSNGVVTGLFGGEATITATTVNGISATSKVTVIGNREFTRLFGSDRYETNYKIAEALRRKNNIWDFDAVVVVDGRNFADALAGSFLAAKVGAPILMTDMSVRNIDGIEEYVNFYMKDEGTVYILGGYAAVSARVEKLLADYKVVRLAGNNRYETNMKILDEGIDGIYEGKIVVATGTNFADSLSVSATGLPIMLVGKQLTEDQVKFIKDNKITEVVIVGGTSAVSLDIEDQIKGVLSSGTVVSRIAGASRYETSTMVAKAFFPDSKNAVLAYAKNFPDGLSGGALAYSLDAPLILTDGTNYKVASNYMKDKKIITGYVLGGAKLVTDKAARSIFKLESNEVIKDCD
ncbi:MAG: cell wall-binding repeat-containing protein [Erysipelotrichaceae bacterium]|nr:cell wall-binding repeat-containing protein [Erysipelotrichaceae bacterium]